MIFKSFKRVAAAVMAFCPLFWLSCEKPVDESVLELSLKSESVLAEAGSQFVSVKCNSSWTLSLTSEQGSVDWAKLSQTSGNGSTNSLILTYEQNLAEEDRCLTLVLDNGKRSISAEMVQRAAGEVDNPSPAPSPTPNPDVKKTAWLELPEMSDESLGYYSHHFEMNGSTYRNYTFAWSQKDLVSLWMAYPLCKMYTNKAVSRTDEWNYDPHLGKLSSAPFGGYGGDYARGHQVPSADRLCCYNANIQTFYGTNMTPQLNNHNEGVWANLENMVRTWANTSDTTYVVTGCVVDGATKFTVDSDGKKMTVPVAYFKALLRYHKASTISQWSGAAFYLEHRSYVSSEANITKTHEAVMSIDELEKKLGLDLYVNLPEKLGEQKAAEIEAQDPASISLWW